MCSTDVYCSKQTGSSSNQSEIHHPSFLRFWNWAEEKLSMQPKFVAAQKMLLKQKPANIRKWIARFYYFRHLYSAGSACVLLTIIAWVAHRYGQLPFALLINILLGSFQLFLHKGSASSEGEIIPFSGTCQSGEAALSTPEAVVASRTDWYLLWCATDDDQRQHHHAEHHFQL